MLLQHISYYGVISWPQITYINTNVAYPLHGKWVIKHKTLTRRNTMCAYIYIYIYIYIYTHTQYFWSAS